MLQNRASPSVRRARELRAGAVRLLHRAGRRQRGVGLPLSRGRSSTARRSRPSSTRRRTASSAPVQEAFLECGAFQCGFCTPGFMLMAGQLLEEHPDPDDDEIRHYLSGNLCRCAAYPEIIEAVKLAAQKRRAGSALIVASCPVRYVEHASGRKRITSGSCQERTSMTSTIARSSLVRSARPRRSGRRSSASNLGWMFDGYETFALILTVGVALRQLARRRRSIRKFPAYAGTVIAHHAARLGHRRPDRRRASPITSAARRTMIFAILAYSADDRAERALPATGCRSPCCASSSASRSARNGRPALRSRPKLWPDHARGKGAGLMQCGLGIGFFVASFVWLFVGDDRAERLALHVS